MAPIDKSNALLTPFKMGPFQLANCMVYAPLTRCRALGSIPQPAAVTYYTQRASPGQFLIAEGTCIAPEAHGYPEVPGIYTEEQIEAWKPIVKAVKDKGAIFFLQLWHVGRASHQDYIPDGGLPISSSAVAIKEGEVYTKTGAHKYPTPRALEKHEIPAVVEQYATAARNAIRAGFDGVEIHGANGYLIDQFLKDSINKRTDEYGGSIENRCRFALEVTKAVVDAVGAERVGIRVSPYTRFLDAEDSDPVALHIHLLEKLNDFNLLYAHLVAPRVAGNIDREDTEGESLEPFRKVWKSTFIAAGGYTRESGIQAIENGDADLICYGRLFLANPDLPKRFALNAPLNKYDRNTFYTQDQVVGYTDYPTLEEVEQRKASQNINAL